MPMSFDPNRPRGMFPAIDGIEAYVHGAVPPVLGAVFAVGGYFWGLAHPALPLALCIGLGLVVGLLFVPIVFKSVSGLLCAALVALAAVATFWLLNNDVALKHPAPAPAVHSAPASTARKLAGQLFPGVGQ